MSGQTFDGSSYTSQSQINFDKVKLFERISYSIDQLSDCVLDYLNANLQQSKQQLNAKIYSKQEINQIKNLLHATVGNFLVETVKYDDTGKQSIKLQINKENIRAYSNHYLSNGYSHINSNHEFDDVSSTHIPTSKNTFTNRPFSQNQPSAFFTEYQPDEYILHQEIEKLNDIINQMQQEKEWMENQIQQLQYEDIISLKQERQTFEEIKGDLADYISNFKKNFLSTQLNCQKASDIIQSDLFNEFYDILTTTENNWKISKFNNQVHSNYKDDIRFFNLGWKQKNNFQFGAVELKKRSLSVDQANLKPKINKKRNEKLSDLNEQIIEKEQKIQQVKSEKDIEFSIFHTFLRQFAQNTTVESLENKACIEEQQEIIEKQQQIIIQIQHEQQSLNQKNEQNNYINPLKAEAQAEGINQPSQDQQKKRIQNYQQEFDDNGDSPIFSHLRAGKQEPEFNQKKDDELQNKNFDEHTNCYAQTYQDQISQNNFRKSSEFNNLRRKRANKIGVERDQEDKVLFTLNSDEGQVDEEGVIIQEDQVKINTQKKSNSCLMDLPLQIKNMKQSGNANQQIGNNIINIPSNNMNFTIGNDQSDFLLQNIDPSFNQEINNISCINKLEDEPQQIINFLETLEQKPTSRFMCQSSFKKQKIAQNLNVNLYKQNQQDNAQRGDAQYDNLEGDQYNEINDEFIHLDQIQVNPKNGLPRQLFKNNSKSPNYEDYQCQEPFTNNYQRDLKINTFKNKKPIMMSFNNKEDIINSCNQQQEQDDQVEKSKIESFMNENFDDVNNSLNLEDFEQIEELCDQNINQHAQQKKIKHLKNIDLPKLDLSTINCTDQIKNMRMTIGQQFMNNQSIAALQISSCKNQTNQLTNPQSLFNMISPIHSTQQLNNRHQPFTSKRNNTIQSHQLNQDNQNNYQQGLTQQGVNKLNESILNQTNINPNNNTQIELLKGLNDTVLNQMEKIEIERSNFYQNYQNILNEKNDILQREIIIKNNMIDLQREVQILTEENSRLVLELDHQKQYIEREMGILQKENENNKIKKDKLRQAKEQLTFRKKQLEDKEKLVGQQQLMNMLQEKKIIFQKQSLDQQWSEQDKRKAEIERSEKLLNDEWENVKKETKKIQEFISKQKIIKENHQKEMAKEMQFVQQQKEEITAQHKILNQKENDIFSQENILKEREKKKEDSINISLKTIKQKEDQLREKENILKERENTVQIIEKMKDDQLIKNKDFEERQSIIHKKEQELRERENLTKIALQESIAKKNRYNEELKRLKEYEENLSRKEQELTALKYEIMSEKMKFQEQQDKIKQDRTKFKGMIPNLKTLANRMSDYEDNGSEISNSQSSRSGSLLRSKKY